MAGSTNRTFTIPITDGMLLKSGDVILISTVEDGSASLLGCFTVNADVSSTTQNFGEAGMSVNITSSGIVVNVEMATGTNAYYCAYIPAPTV